MDSELLKELHDHANHLAVVKGTSADDLARGVGLMLLALEELLSKAEKQLEPPAAKQQG